MRVNAGAKLGQFSADMVLEPFQDAADRAVELLSGAPEEERTDIRGIDTEEKQVS